MAKLAISTVVEQQGRCVHQTSPPGRFAKIMLRIEPKPDSDEVVFVNSASESSDEPELASFYVSGVEKGVREFAGRLGVVQTRVTLIEMKIHPVDSNELSFKLAAIQAMEDAFARFGVPIEGS